MRNIAIFGWYGHRNLGDEWIFEAAKGLLDRFGGEYTLTIYGDPYCIHDEHAVLHTRNIKSILKDAWNCDAFFYAGGGAFPTKNNLKILFYVLVNAIYRLRHKPVICLGLSVESFHFESLLTRRLLKWFAATSSLLSVRDQSTFSEFSRFFDARPAQLLLSPDTVFSWEGKRGQAPAGTYGIVALANLFHRVSDDGRQMRAFAEAIAVVLGKLEESGYAIHLTAFCEQDEEINRMVQTMLPEKTTWVHDYSETDDQVFGLAENASFVIGMRFHSLVLAQKAKRPYFAISYASKCKGFMHDMHMDAYQVEFGTGEEEYLCKNIPLDPDEMYPLILEMLRDSDAVNEQLEENERTIMEGVARLEDAFAQVLSE